MKKILFSLLCATSVSAFATIGDGVKAITPSILISAGQAIEQISYFKKDSSFMIKSLSFTNHNKQVLNNNLSNINQTTILASINKNTDAMLLSSYKNKNNTLVTNYNTQTHTFYTGENVDTSILFKTDFVALLNRFKATSESLGIDTSRVARISLYYTSEPRLSDYIISFVVAEDELSFKNNKCMEYNYSLKNELDAGHMYVNCFLTLEK